MTPLDKKDAEDRGLESEIPKEGAGGRGPENPDMKAAEAMAANDANTAALKKAYERLGYAKDKREGGGEHLYLKDTELVRIYIDACQRKLDLARSARAGEHTIPASVFEKMQEEHRRMADIAEQVSVEISRRDINFKEEAKKLGLDASEETLFGRYGVDHRR